MDSTHAHNNSKMVIDSSGSFVMGLWKFIHLFHCFPAPSPLIILTIIVIMPMDVYKF